MALPHLNIIRRKSLHSFALPKRSVHTEHADGGGLIPCGPVIAHAVLPQDPMRLHPKLPAFIRPLIGVHPAVASSRSFHNNQHPGLLGKHKLLHLKRLCRFRHPRPHLDCGPESNPGPQKSQSQNRCQAPGQHPCPPVSS